MADCHLHRRTGTVAMLLLCSALPAPAAPNRFHTFQSDGSVGDRLNALAADRHGFIWAAGEGGVYRFDGQHYRKIPGFPFASASFIAVDPAGIVWAGGAQGLARYSVSTAEWKVMESEPVWSMTATRDGLWFASGGLQLITPSGEQRTIPDSGPSGALVADSSGAIWFPCGAAICTVRPPDMRLESQPNPVPGNWKKVVPGAGGKVLWLGSASGIASVEKGTLRSRQSAPSGMRSYAETFAPQLGRDGSVWTIWSGYHVEPGLGLWPTPNATTDSCSWFEDAKTRWFCSGVSVGESKLDPDWQTWIGGQFVTLVPHGLVSRAGKNPLLMTDRGIYTLNEQNPGGTWDRAASFPSVDVTRMLPDGSGGYWVSSREEGLVRIGPDLSIVERVSAPCSKDGLRGFYRSTAGRTWIGGKDQNCFFEVTGRPGKWRFEPQALPGNPVNVVAVHADSQGRPWVGYNDGLAFFDPATNGWRAIKTSEPVTLVREFAFDGDAAIWVSRRRPGPFLRLERHGDLWQVQRFENTQFPPTETFDLLRDHRGWIWRGTNIGVAVSRTGMHESRHWLRILRETGLGLLNVGLSGILEDDKGAIWITGSSGVARIKPSGNWFEAPHTAKPLVTRVSIDGRTWLDPDHMPAHIEHGAGAIEVDLSSREASPFRTANLRYRLEPGGTDWQETVDGTLKFSGLGDGNYTLLATYTGDGATQVMQWSFQVGNPLWRLMVPTTGFGLLALTGMFGWHKRRWLGYWLEKPVFLWRNRFHTAEDVVWNNHVGRTLASRYHIIEPISRGGFAVTYLARDLQQDRNVAVKVLHRSPGQESWVRHRFAHEIAAMMTLHHPGIVRLLDSWISKDGEPCLAMELLEGPTLRHLLATNGALPPERAAGLIEQLGEALSVIHSRGIVHRDLKPENVMVLPVTGIAAERPVIIDFGTSAARGPEGDLEMTTSLTGSLPYLAPERLNRQYSPASDVYSLAVILLEMLTARRTSDFQVAPGHPDFVLEIGKMIGELPAALLVRAFEHLPLNRPVDVEAWTREVAAALRAAAPHD